MCGYGSYATTGRNYPVTEAGTLEVFGVFSSMCTQRYTSISGKTYIRNLYFDNPSSAKWIIDSIKYSLFYPKLDKSINSETEISMEFFDANKRNDFNFVYSSADNSLKCTKSGLYKLNVKLYVVIETDYIIRSRVIFYKNSEEISYFELQGRRGMASSTNILRLDINDKLFIKHKNVGDSFPRIFKGGETLNNLLIERLGD